MAYEDTIRVADLKIRATRSARVRNEVGVNETQVMSVTEYMHPRLQEVCETLPASIGSAILRSRSLRAMLERRFQKGRHVETTSLRWFLVLRLLASLRRMRRSTLRYKDEQQRITNWLDLVREAAASDQALAAEILENQSLLKGYSDTYERGLRNFELILPVARGAIGQSDAAERIRDLRTAALADDTGKKLCEGIDRLAS
jgi:indolepyruvate ferredoxin oxidoreductase beta subunit